jgi:hypothetical protein
MKGTFTPTERVKVPFISPGIECRRLSAEGILHLGGSA